MNFADENPMIQANNVVRSFRSIQKEPGLKGAFKNIWSPTYQEHKAVDSVSFTISKGSFVGLIGANGAGKTTLLKMLSGLLPPTTGSVRVLSEDPFARSLFFRKNISLVMGQKAQLWWDLTAADAFQLLRVIYEVPREVHEKRLTELIGILRVEKLMKTQLRKLSLGERMKMELIGALLHEPKVVFLDEPTIGLDVVAAQSLRSFLKEYNLKYQATIILTSHNMDDIERLCSRVMIMKAGKLVYDGRADSLKTSQTRQLKVQLLNTVSQLEYANALKVELDTVRTEEDDSGISWTALELPQDKIQPAIQTLLNKNWIQNFRIEEPSLEFIVQKIYNSHDTSTLS